MHGNISASKIAMIDHETIHTFSLLDPPRIRIPFSAVYLIYAFCFGKWLLHFFISFAIKRVLTNYNVIFLLCWGTADLRNQAACYFYDMLSFYHLCFEMYSPRENWSIRHIVFVWFSRAVWWSKGDNAIFFYVQINLKRKTQKSW